MICEHCGTEHDTGIQRFDDNAYQAACRDALKAQLAEREAEFNALHVMWKNVSGALCDAETVVVYERDYARSVRELTAERDALKAELATAVEGLKIIDATDDENSIAAQAMRSVANGALHALGIDPSEKTQ